MAKDREIACQYYLNEKNCQKGHDGIFKKTCQYCKDYIPLKNGKPRRINKRKKEKEKLSNSLFIDL